MFGMGWAEMMIVGVVALIVVGPKELPIMFRKLGQAVGKAKGMAREFSKAMNDAADGAGMKDAMDSVKSATDGLNSIKSPTKAWTNYVPGSETEQLAAQKAERTKAIKKTMAERAEAKAKAEADAEAAAEVEATDVASQSKPAVDAGADEKDTDKA